VAAAGDYELVDRISSWIGDNDWDAASVEQYCPYGFPDEKIEKA
jgi:hypothetical protein